MYFPPLVTIRIKHAAMINVLTDKLLGSLGTKLVYLKKNTKHLSTLDTKNRHVMCGP